MTGVCPDCGSPLPKDAALMGLCPQCLLSMALEDDEPETLHGEGAGRILGERYQIREVLGRGGMGEVYRAFDLKLRVDVALKTVRPELSTSEKARDLLRQEVRSAREVLSPNVCRIFDLVVEEGRELVSMEYIDGTTLAETLRERGPLELQEAREIAAQFLSGLEAIHEAGLVHRDFKPENVMLTRAGRVVVMDFGLAKARSEGNSKSIAGTPAYMSPEQLRGEAVDARSDVFSAGVVLSEMLWDGARPAVWHAVRETPPRVPEGPWAAVLRQALSLDRESRHPTARALARALDEVTHRLPGFEDKHPYPGLASFTQEDAEYFFGREMEVETVWKKLKRPRLLALIGPSGAGKSSFLRAGLLPTLPAGWRVVLSTPGHRPFSALAEALLPAFAGDMHAIQSFLRFDEPETAISLFSAWRQKSEHALVIVDQFEELFTLNPPEVQEAFTTILGRLVLEADVHVLLALRDDFLFHCQKHDALSPVFSELTPLGTLSPSALRRALVQPAVACGYRFEDEALVEEMVSEVSHERGVLPLLAFAASRLWEKRDREKGLLTREAYQEIGGVGGALAQHAEETLERIGARRTPLVRELFRNLVTAQGTRASREVEELLSIFPKEEERKAAEEVLRELIAARLLTAYEDSVEIIHESLLSAWPRLVRWRNQDEGGALLRDQLRQAAQAWRDRGRPDDLLWSGTSFREFSLWREHYSGALTAAESEFAAAMTAHAQQRRRRRRMALASGFALLIGVVVVVSLFWRQAVSEARRAEAAKLLALGQLEIEEYPTGAVAYALRSLELSDTTEARLFVLEALERAPLAFLLPRYDGRLDALALDWSPDASWLALADNQSRFGIWPRDGGPPALHDSDEGPSEPAVHFSPQGDFLLAGRKNGIGFWSVPGLSALRGLELDESSNFQLAGDRLFTFEWEKGVLRSLALDQIGPHIVARLEGVKCWVASPDGKRVSYTRDRDRNVYVLEAVGSSWSAARIVGQHNQEAVCPAFDKRGESVASWDESGAIRSWSVTATSPEPARIFALADARWPVAFDSAGARLAFGKRGAIPRVGLLDLKGPPDADPILLQWTYDTFLSAMDFDPLDNWLATTHTNSVNLWLVSHRYPRILRKHQLRVTDVAFSADGKWLLSSSQDGTVRIWPLTPEAGAGHRVLLQQPLAVFPQIDLDSSGRRLVVGGSSGKLLVLSLDGGAPRELNGFGGASDVLPVALDSRGRLAAAAVNFGARQDKVIRVWDLDSGETKVLGPLPGAGEGFQGRFGGLTFTGDGRLLSSSSDGVHLWDLEDGSYETLQTGPWNESSLTLSPNGRYLLVRGETLAEPGQRDIPEQVVTLHDMKERSRLTVTWYREGGASAFDATSTILATGGPGGIIRVGRIGDSEPHLLLGHEGSVRSVAISPDGRTVASAGEDGTIRLWPMPDLSKPPFQTLPREELLAKLRSVTNLRAVRDPGSATGYKLEPGPFPGWTRLPEW